jgi:hypothetical protein
MILLTATSYLPPGFRQYLVYLNEKLDKGEAEAFSATSAAVEQSADILHAPVQREKDIVHSFRYLY